MGQADLIKHFPQVALDAITASINKLSKKVSRQERETGREGEREGQLREVDELTLSILPSADRLHLFTPLFRSCRIWSRPSTWEDRKESSGRLSPRARRRSELLRSSSSPPSTSLPSRAHIPSFFLAGLELSTTMKEWSTRSSRPLEMKVRSLLLPTLKLESSSERNERADARSTCSRSTTLRNLDKVHQNPDESASDRHQQGPQSSRV